MFPSEKSWQPFAGIYGSEVWVLVPESLLSHMRMGQKT